VLVIDLRDEHGVGYAPLQGRHFSFYDNEVLNTIGACQYPKGTGRR
jgi:hypothetical protein